MHAFMQALDADKLLICITIASYTASVLNFFENAWIMQLQAAKTRHRLKQISYTIYLDSMLQAFPGCKHVVMHMHACMMHIHSVNIFYIITSDQIK